MRTEASREAAGHADILFATTIAGTTEAFINPVAASLAAQGHRIALVAGDRLPRAEYPHSSVVLPMRRGISPGSDLEALRRWVLHLRSVKPRIVVMGTPKASLLGLVAAYLARVPTRVYVIHGAVWDGATGSRRLVLEAAERATIASSTHQLAVSDSLAHLVHARGLSPRIPEVLGSGSFCGVDVEEFSPPESSDRSAFRMCFVGRINRDKGVEVLLRTLDRVRMHVDASLTVVGGLDATAPPDQATLDVLAHHPHVSWVGEVSDVAAHLRKSSIMLFPTAREGLGQVLLEAQACGVPVVSWRVTGVVDAVSDGSTGILVEYGDEWGLTRAALTLLTDRDLHGQMARNARNWVVDRFERESVVALNVQYMEGLLTGDGDV